MASTLKRMLVGEARSQEESTNVYDRDSDPEGMTGGEESELDHFHANESDISKQARTTLSLTRPRSSHTRENMFWNCGRI